MTLRTFLPSTSGLPSASGWHSEIGNPAGPCTTDRDHHARGHRQSPWADDEEVRRQGVAPSPVGATLHAAAGEVRETMAGVALIVRFAVFVAAILVEHHLRRLWPAAAKRGAVAIGGAMPQTTATCRQGARRARGPSRQPRQTTDPV
jgi:hypothetical protein